VFAVDDDADALALLSDLLQRAQLSAAFRRLLRPRMPGLRTG